MDFPERNLVGLIRAVAADAEDLVRESAHQPAPRVAREHEQPPIAVVGRKQRPQMAAVHHQRLIIVRRVQVSGFRDAGVRAESLRLRR